MAFFTLFQPEVFAQWKHRVRSHDSSISHGRNLTHRDFLSGLPVYKVGFQAGEMENQEDFYWMEGATWTG